jgi:hypothetical protein
VVNRYRFLDPMGDVVLERQFADHEAALSWANAGPDDDPDLAETQIQRVEYLGPGGDWRWAGALQG